MPKKSKAAKAPKKAKAPKTPKIARIVKNDVARPKPGGNTARIWEICDSITEKTGAPAFRKDVLAQTEKEKIPVATGATQYNLWRNFNGFTGRLQPGKLKAPKVKLPKPPKKAGKGRIGSAKPKMPKPPAKKTEVINIAQETAPATT